VGSDAELEHDRPSVSLELLDGDLFGLVDEPFGQVLQQSPGDFTGRLLAGCRPIAHARVADRPSGSASVLAAASLDALDLQQLAHGVRRLRASCQPGARAL